MPTFAYEKCDKLIEVNKQVYDELEDALGKFSAEFDSELVYEMDRYIKTNLSSKKVSEINVKDDFKIADINFKNAKLKKLSEIVKRRRIEMYMTFNKIFLSQLPYISTNSKDNSMAKLLNEVKSMILFSMKNQFLQKYIDELPKGERADVTLKRRMA